MGLDFDEFKETYQKVPVEEYPNRVVEAVPDPVVSIHVSTYQHADFIEKCLDGVLMQETEFPVEVIIGEDESTDGTREICIEYAERYPETIRLFLHERENNISVLGRPTGKFQLVYSQFVARGKYIAICEGDDYWRDRHKIQKQVSALEETPEYSLSYHDAFIKSVEGDTINSSMTVGEKETLSRIEMKKAPNVPTMSMLYRNVIEEFPKEFFEVSGEDVFISSILGHYGKGLFQSEINKSVHLVHKNGIFSGLSSKGKKYDMLNNQEKILKYYERVNCEAMSDYFSKEVVNRIRSIVCLDISNGKYWTATREYVENIRRVFELGGARGVLRLSCQLLRFSFGQLLSRRG